MLSLRNSRQEVEFQLAAMCMMISKRVFRRDTSSKYIPKYIEVFIVRVVWLLYSSFYHFTLSRSTLEK
jgi:hypothetical protein